MNKFIALVSVMLLGGASQASYLYWQVDTADAEGIAFNYARVVADNGSGAQILDITDDVGVTKEGYAVVAKGAKAAINLDQLGDASAYSFYIELVNYDSSAKTFDVVGSSQANPTSYANLVAANFISLDDVMQIPSTEVWHGGTYSVPEPTSAMLVMMGLGLLALKRKNA